MDLEIRRKIDTIKFYFYFISLTFLFLLTKIDIYFHIYCNYSNYFLLIDEYLINEYFHEKLVWLHFGSVFQFWIS